MKLIEFKDGKWGVRRWNWFQYSYLDARYDVEFFWYSPEYVNEYAKFKTKEDAIKRYEEYRLHNDSTKSQVKNIFKLK